MYLLEGNIGAGKTTLLNLIHNHIPSLEIVTEPVAAWSIDQQGKSLLTEFYNNTQRWTYTMETFTLTTRIKEYVQEQKNSNSLRIMERSIYSGYHCFAKNGYLHGFMTDLEWHAYNQLFTFLVSYLCKPPTGFIYLQTPPSICYERTKKRNRSGEESIPLTYLEQIHEQHEQFLIQKHDIASSLTTVPVLVIDGSTNFDKDGKALANIMQQIESFTLQHSLTIPTRTTKRNPKQP